MYTLSDKISYINSLFINSLWLGIFNGGLKTGALPLPTSRRQEVLRPIKDLTEKEPRVHRRSDGSLVIECGEGDLDGLALYAELADTIEKRLEETGRR